MLYELEAFNTETYTDVRYRAYTTSKKKADAFASIPKIQFTDSGHGIVFSSRQVSKRRSNIGYLTEYMRKYL